jgi:hypothetical protein
LTLGRRSTAGFALLTSSMLAAEIVLSRLFAVTLGYYYAFVLISLAMLGLASGALIVQGWRISEEHIALYAFRLSMLSGFALFGATIASIVEYPLVNYSWPLTLMLMFITFTPFFVASGTAVALVLCYSGTSFRRFYAIDLIAASAGCVGAVVLLAKLSPVVVALSVLSVSNIVAAYLFARESGGNFRWRVAAYSASFCCLLGISLARVGAIANPPRYDWAKNSYALFHDRWNRRNAGCQVRWPQSLATPT